MSEIDWERLIEIALDVRERAYAPYSNYRVGAALLTQDGQIFSGCNVENASYPVCLCAEQAAIGAAMSAGCREFTALVVATPGDRAAPPCGKCRQALNEFAPDLPIVLITPGGARDEWKLSDLLPGAFGPKTLSEGRG